MSKTYEALMLAERLRAAQDPAALARQLAEERESLSARLQVFQEQLEALTGKVDVTPAIDPTTIDNLRSELARLAAEQARQAEGPQQQLQAAVQLCREELSRQALALERHSAAVAEIRQQVADLQASITATLDSQHQETSDLRRLHEEHLEEHLRDEQGLREHLAAKMDSLRAELAHTHERMDAEQEERRALRTHTAEQQQALSSLSTEVTHRLEALSEDSRATQQELGQRLATAEATATQERSASELRLAALVDRLRASETQQAHQAEQLNRIRTELAGLMEMRQEPPADLLGRIDGAEAKVEIAAQRAEVIAGEQASNITAIRERLEILQQEHTHLVDAVGSLKAHGPQALRLASELETLRQGLVVVQEEKRQHQEEVVATIERDRVAVTTLAQRIAALEQENGADLARLRQQVVESQANQRALRETVEGLPATLAQELASEEDLHSLRVQVRSVQEVEAQQRNLVTQVTSAHAAIDEAIRRVATLEAGQSSNQASTRQQIAALQTDGNALRKALEALRLSLTRQLESSAEAEVEAVREQLAPLIDAQMRQERLAREVQRAQTTADEAVRLAKIDKGYVSNLATLKEQIAELLADRVRVDQGIERRFELLCGIVDESIQHEKERMDHGIALFHEEAARRAGELEAKLARLEAYVEELAPGALRTLESEAKPKKTLTSVLGRRRPARKQ